MRLMRGNRQLEVVAGDGIGAPDRLVARHALSTDFLNRYNEALMLIEMAAVDVSLIDDLKSWRPSTYIEHFAHSGLRCAPGALSAFRSLPEESRGAFNALCLAMDQLVRTVVTALSELKHPDDAVFIVEIASSSFRSLLTRATAFINSGGDMAEAAYCATDLQSTVDKIVAA